MSELTGKDRRALRALGNALKPVIFIGKDGVTEAVLAAVDDAHRGQELIKAKVLDTCPLDRREAAAALDAASASSVVQILGRTLLLYRRDPEHPRILLPSFSAPRAD